VETFDGPEPAPAIVPLTTRFVRAWAVAGVLALIAWIATDRFAPIVPPLAVSRSDAVTAARDALSGRRAALEPSTRLLPLPDAGHADAHRFVWQEGGRDRYAALLGRYLATPRWLVRAATFDGDVADRAEEWTVLVNHRGEAERTAHQLPESRAAPSLNEGDARRAAVDAIKSTFGLAEDTLREVSVEPSKLAGRTDWLFTFQDTTVDPIPVRGPAAAAPDAAAPPSESRGEARIEVEIAGNEVARVRPFVHVPEEWERAERGRNTLFRIIGLLALVIAGSVLVAAAGSGLVAWSRHEFAPRVFYAILAVFALTAAAAALNGWPSTVATFSTAQPYSLQVLTRLGIGLVGLLMPAAIVALAAGALPFEMPMRRIIPRGTAALLGGALGTIVVAAGAVTHSGGEPPWPDVSAFGTFVPFLAGALSPIPAFLLRTVTLMALLATVDHLTHGWTRRRLPIGAGLFVAGAVLGAPGADGIGEWVTAAGFSGAGLVAAYGFLLRDDLSLTPFAVAAMVAAAQIHDAFESSAIDHIAGSILGAALVAFTAWWLCGLLRHARVSGPPHARQA
jgi:hypothetical protein